MKSSRAEAEVNDTHTAGLERKALPATPVPPAPGLRTEKELLFLELFEVGAALALPQLLLPPTGTVEEAGNSGEAGSGVAGELAPRGAGLEGSEKT